MTKLIFNLKSVPFDEADDVKNLLTDNEITYFESPPGNWGISVHALWLNDESQAMLAKQLIDEYQLKRSQRMKLEMQEKIDNGDFETLFQRLFNRPVQSIVYLAIVLLILYFSIMPFFGMVQE